MTINKFKMRIFGIYFFVLFVSCYEGLCQSYSIIDIDKIEVIQLPDQLKEDQIHDVMFRFNDFIKVKSKVKTIYDVDYIPNYQPPKISKGSVFINLDNTKRVYDLESVNEISDFKNSYYSEYIVNVYSRKEYTKNETYKSMFGEYPSKIVNYLISVDATTEDTLWMQQTNNTSVYSTKQLSQIGDFIIDNKTGDELYKLSSSKPLNISEIKEDNGYLYLRKSGEIIAIDLQKGEAIWRVEGDFNKFFIDESRIYTSNQCAIDKKTGKLIWSNSSEIWFVGIVDNFLIGYLYNGEDDPEVYVYDKNTGKLLGYLWSDNVFCSSCFGFESCNPKFIFAEQGEGNKTAALVKCNEGVYLYTFEVINK